MSALTDGSGREYNYLYWLLQIDPVSDTLIRVFMAWKAADQPQDIMPQVLTGPERHGFTAVEWGGSQIKQAQK